jgi:hypothetical protein
LQDLQQRYTSVPSCVMLPARIATAMRFIVIFMVWLLVFLWIW